MKIAGEEDAERALHYLRKTDEEHGKLRASVKAHEYRLKSIKAQYFLQASGTMAEKEARSLTHPDYIKAIDEFENVSADFMTCDAKRESAHLTIALYQTKSANTRKGNI